MRGIGDVKAKAIVDKREQRGKLTIDNIKEIKQISKELWSSLFAEGKFSLGDQETTDKKGGIVDDRDLTYSL